MIPTTASSSAAALAPPQAMRGIASLILEGRAISDDDFLMPENQQNQSSALLVTQTDASGIGYAHHISTVVVGPSQSTPPLSVDPTVQHFQRLREKLGQLRQSSPSTSRDPLPVVDQKITVSSRNSATASDVDSEPIPEATDYEDIMQRLVTRRSSTTSASAPHQSDNLLLTLQSLATTCLWSTPRAALARSDRDLLDTNLWQPPHAKYSATPQPQTSTSSLSSFFSSSNSSIGSPSAASGSGSKPAGEKRRVAPKMGPHCDQFLRKLGLAKGEAAEAEEHICDNSTYNEICYRWQIHCREIDFISTRCEPICIEVYLGPENHFMLLEQWTIQKRDKVPSPNMTMQSLCNAIRSQLYFSQVTAWCDLIRKSDRRDLLDTGRVKYHHNSNVQKSSPRLDIFYRIRKYDSTACFNAKPIVHNFPSVIISENCSISVCLKSLPRINGGIPAVGEPSFGLSSSAGCSHMEVAGGACSAQTLDRLNPQCKEKGKHKCVFDEEDGSSDAAAGEGNCSMEGGVLSHREKQLMKYKKRMMKRDKKTRKGNDPPVPSSSSSISDGANYAVAMEEQSTELPSNGQLPALPEYGSINSIRPPLYQTVSNSITESVQTHPVEMISIGTQTANFPVGLPSCDQCGNEMVCVCFTCDNLARTQMETNPLPPVAKVEKAELLLQAIQRTPAKSANNNNSPCYRNGNGALSTLAGKSSPGLSDCQLCKRQKTQHHYRRKDQKEYNNNNNNISANGCTLGDTCDSGSSCGCSPSTSDSSEVRMTVEDDDDDQDHKNFTAIKSNKQPQLSPTAQFKTPTQSPSSSSSSVRAQHKNSKPTLLQITCMQQNKSIKSLPKVNLTQLFCNGTSSTSPIPISTPEAFTFDNISSPEIPVQKSNSAPTLPNSPSTLSPRFAKQAAIYKRRSRHLSDRSDRSSFGSDEQFSDEDIDSLYSPATSPIKNRLFPRSSAFGRRPLLGNLEESLLQKRFVPKAQVAGFKVLLGASGGFCPTQLTIPSVAYFYELPGQALSTPYMCEIRMPRKGYTIPRTGTVQATLLNPVGTVVRMFVIPYDFRDMPPMHQTFIRQRVLAVDSEIIYGNSKSNNCNGTTTEERIGQLSSREQMLLLRYSIHLRFQTSRSGRLALHNDIRLLISRRTDCDTAAAHAKGVLESPNELKIVTITPDQPKYSARQENPNKI